MSKSDQNIDFSLKRLSQWQEKGLLSLQHIHHKMPEVYTVWPKQINNIRISLKCHLHVIRFLFKTSNESNSSVKVKGNLMLTR